MLIFSHGFGFVQVIVGVPPIPEMMLDTRRILLLPLLPVSLSMLKFFEFEFEFEFELDVSVEFGD